MSGDFLILPHRMVEVSFQVLLFFSSFFRIFQVLSSSRILFFIFWSERHSILWSLLSVNLQVEVQALDLFSPEDGRVYISIISLILLLSFVLGVGIAMIINSLLGTLYYNVLIAWALFYFFLSFRTRLLWSDCGNWWNSKRCFVPGSPSNFFTQNETTWNCTETQLNNSFDYGCQEINVTGRVTATEEFF
jgi:hypothetical protein